MLRVLLLDVVREWRRHDGQDLRLRRSEGLRRRDLADVSEGRERRLHRDPRRRRLQVRQSEREEHLRLRIFLQRLRARRNEFFKGPVLRDGASLLRSDFYRARERPFKSCGQGTHRPQPPRPAGVPDCGRSFAYTWAGAPLYNVFSCLHSPRSGSSPSGVWMKIFRGTIFLLLAAFILLAELGCGDQYRPVANPITGPGGQPQSTHYAYVVNYNPNGDGSTPTIDVSGDTVSWVQTLGVGSIYEALQPQSTSLFVANSGDDTVSAYAAFTNGNVTTIALLPGSHPVFLTATQTTQMYVLNSKPNSACPNIPPDPMLGQAEFGFELSTYI